MKFISLFKKWLGIIMILIGLVILGLLVKKIGLGEFINAVQGIHPGYLILALLFWSINLYIVIFRFKILLGVHDLSFIKTFKLYLQGWLMNYGSAIQGLGVGTKVALLKMHKVPVAKSSSAVTLEILYDGLFCLFAGLLFVLFMGERMLAYVWGFIGNSLFIILVFSIAVVAAFLIIRNKIGFFRSYYRELFGHVKDSRGVFLSSLLTIVSWGVVVGMNYFIIKSLDGDVGLIFILGALTLGMILGLATLIPGGLGVREGIYAYIYNLAGLPLGIALVAAIISRILSIIIVLLFLTAIEWFKISPEKLSSVDSSSEKPE